MPPSNSPKLLEVIVTSLADAIEAEAGGADRLEVVRALEVGGLTPDLPLVRRIALAVKLPLRVMLRENPSMSLVSPDEVQLLCRYARDFEQLAVDGLVAGFLIGGHLDLHALQTITQAAPSIRITFHRAFDELAHPEPAIHQLKTVPQVDRILTVGGAGSWPDRKRRLHRWQQCAAPEIAILAGAGLAEPVISDLLADPILREVHLGRAVREPRETTGLVSRRLVAQLKGLTA